MSGILLVCTGNICRSPMAEGFLRAALEARMGAAAPPVRSAGTAGWEGSPAMEESIVSARERGVDITEHVARQLEDDMLEEADVVVCMAAEHREAIVWSRPEFLSRVFTLKELVRLLEQTSASGSIRDRIATASVARNGKAHRGEDVHDPLGEPLEGYRKVADELYGLTERLADALTRGSS
jgi:protein-tyrosine phosphatase